MPWDPEESARQTGHAHEIPPNVRRLSAKERRDLTAWADRVVKARERRAGLEITLTDISTEPDPLLIRAALEQRTHSLGEYLRSKESFDGRERVLISGRLLDLHLIIDRLQVVLLGFEIEHEIERQSERTAKSSAKNLPL